MIEVPKTNAVSTAGRLRTRGFTLAEAIMVIVIVGILSAVVAVFIQKPVQGFFDTARRATLVDAADTALSRISRDLHDALPNSVRINGTALEFLHVRSGGRYRQQIAPPPAAIPGDILDFTTADTSFDVLGPTVNVQSGDSVVVYNLGAGVTGFDAYAGTVTNRRLAAAPFGASLSNVAIISTASFTSASPAARFQVVDTPVSYVCSGTQMRRYSGYAIAGIQPVPPAGSGALVADKLSACSFAYATGPSQREALVTLSLALTDGVETVSLLYEVHVNNAP